MDDESYMKKNPIIPPPFRNYLFKEISQQQNSAIFHQPLIPPSQNGGENIKPVIHNQVKYYRRSDAIKIIKAELEKKDQEVRDQFIKELISELAADQAEPMEKEVENMFF